MNKRFFLVIALLFAAYVGCAPVQSEPAHAAPTQAKPVKVGFVATNFSAESQARVAGRFEAAAKEKGWDSQILNSAGDINTQASQLENLLQMKVDAVVLAMAHPLDVKPALDKLVEAGVHVITIDSGYVDGVVADITSDNFGVGAKMSTYLVDTLGGSGNVVVIKFEKHQGSRRRGKVLDAVLSEYTGVKVLDSFSVNATKRFMDDTRDAMETFVTKHGDKIDGVWCAFDQLAYVAGDVIADKLKGKKVVIVAADGNRETFRRIAAGSMTATVAQPFEAMADMAVSMVEQLTSGKTQAEVTGGKKIVYVDTPLYDASNLPEVK
ncbi:MAG: sugar ABC transporter substrate-binding protein [Synergistaceae bacterium]|jgi:ABC-type sugar transport system substrate-binding protein|nr:sugar ABC transporter substrate-binding protein [Synergistaceae bacterium]